MPIYDLGYRAYEGRIRGRTFRWWPIAWRCFRASLRWPFVAAVFLGAMPMFMRCFQAYLIGLAHTPVDQMTSIEARIARFAQKAFQERFSFDDTLFHTLLSNEVLFVTLVLWVVGAGQIAEDFRTGALQVYFSKPISQLDYVLGKLGSVLLGAACLTILPSAVLFLHVIAFAPDWTWLTENPWLPLKILAFSAVIGLVLGSLVLAISSFARSGRMAGLTFFGLYIFSAVLSMALPEILADRAWNAVYLKGCLDAVGATIFTNTPVPDVNPDTAWLVLTGVVIASLLVFIRKVDAVEVVS